MTYAEATDGGLTGAAASDDDATDVVEAAGHFRIYLGAAAGVGKTYAMLNEGHRRKQRGTDVVIGFVESHGRPLTEELCHDLEIVPRRVIDYRGTRFEEMDLDAALARRPKVALIDELAHTNVPGSRHTKRWEDVLEILDAGIDVITTVNIQHLESVADAVEQMTGAQVRERVPDWVVRKADQIELVDSSPEALRRRMLHGNIYPQAKVPQALTHFFRTDNLIALRELAFASWLTKPKKSCSSTSSATRPRWCGKPASASWWPSPLPRAPTPSSAGPPGWPAASRPTCTSSTSSPATARADHTKNSSPSCASWPPMSAPTGTRSKPTTPPKPSSSSPETTRSPRSWSAPAAAPDGRNSRAEGRSSEKSHAWQEPPGSTCTSSPDAKPPKNPHQAPRSSRRASGSDRRVSLWSRSVPATGNGQSTEGFAIIPAMFLVEYPKLKVLNVMDLNNSHTAIGFH